MSSPLIEALASRHGFASVNELNLDDFLKAHERSVLFFAGDSERLVESADVAVILPELVKHFSGLVPALVETAAERPLQLRYRFNAFPALVFFKGDGYLGAIARLLSWRDYLAEIEDILARAPSEPPPYKFPDRCAPQPAANGASEEHYAGDDA
jgi:hydrogenase-1 operon protein HyaE